MDSAIKVERKLKFILFNYSVIEIISFLDCASDEYFSRSTGECKRSKGRNETRAFRCNEQKVFLYFLECKSNEVKTDDGCKAGTYYISVCLCLNNM